MRLSDIMEMLSSSRTWIGVLVAVAGNVTISLALNCQKLAHTRLQNEQHDHQDFHSDEQDGSTLPHQDRPRPATDRASSDSSATLQHDGHTSPDFDGQNGSKSNQNANRNGNANGNGMDTMFLHSKLWWLGLALMTIGEGGNFISYGFAPASLVAPLGAVALLSNVIISPILLHERLRISDIGGILLAIIGAVTVVFSSKQNDVRLDPAQLLQAIKRLEFAIYTTISVCSGGLLAFLSTTSLGDRWVLIDVGTCAIFGGFTVLSTKGISSLISGGQPIEALKFPITYVLVVVLAATAVIQITYLNRALQRFDSREVIPTQFVFFTISAIVGSAILYRDFENMDAHRLVNFLFGCLTTFGGVFVLTWRKEEQPRQDQDVGDESFDEERAEQDGDEVTEHAPLFNQHRRRGSSADAESTSRTPRQTIDFLEPAFTERCPGPSNALRVPSATKCSPNRRPRSRTNSPHQASASAKHVSTSFDRSCHLSRSASNQQPLSSSAAAAGLRTPKLSLIGIDRPTGLSSGHYLLLATPPPSFTLQSVTPIASGGAAPKSALSRGGAGHYGAIGTGAPSKSGPGAFLPFPVTSPGASGSTNTRRAPRNDLTTDAHTTQQTSPPAADPTAEALVTPVTETCALSSDSGADLTARLAEHVADSRSQSDSHT